MQQQQYYQQQYGGSGGVGLVRQTSQQQQQLPPYHPNGSPQRRFLSEGELLGSGGNELSYAGRTNNSNTTENIRELAGSPQRGVYNWKDNSPPGYNPQQMGGIMFTASPAVAPNGQNNNNSNLCNNSNSNNSNLINRPTLQPTQQLTASQYHPDYNSIYHRSNPTSPTQLLQQVSTQPMQFNQNGSVVTTAAQQQLNQPQVTRQSNVNNIINNLAKSAAQQSYHPALRGGIQVFPPQLTAASPQIKRKTPTRPMSFVRALEMADSIEMTATNVGAQQQGGAEIKDGDMGSGNQTPSQQQQQERNSIYDGNYEISV